MNGMKTLNIGISKAGLSEVVRILNMLLADEFVLYVKTRNYHWNVTGLQFHDLHKLFESQCEELDGIIDAVAERARSMGGIAAGSLGEFSKLTRLKEQPAKFSECKVMLKDALEAHESIIRSLRVDVETCATKHQDAGTTDFLTGLMEQHEKMAWMLRATLSR